MNFKKIFILDMKFLVAINPVVSRFFFFSKSKLSLCIAIFSISVFTCPAQKVVTCYVDAAKKYQTISNFGASDCWSAQFIGLWPDGKKNAIADLLFSQEMNKEGQPKGIGLSLWRFNVGAGSNEQGSESGIQTDWRRSECFLNSDGTYDWDKQAGQQWFLKAAKERGVSNFLAFSNSPPVYFTRNGLANNKGLDARLNLKTDKYNEYADYLVHVIKGLNSKLGVKINYISPFNEPEWDWDGNSQEGTPALTKEISSFVKVFDSTLTKNEVETKILVSESGKIDYVYKSATDKPGRDNQTESFFNPDSNEYIGNLTHVEPLMAAHSYWTDFPVSVLCNTRNELWAQLNKYNLGYWQTEYCIMGNNDKIGSGAPKDLSIKTALYVARIIHHDLVLGNASAWQWWLGITYSDYKDGLIYATVDNSKTDGNFTDSKLLWSLGNYSRFVRPGFKRVDVSSNENINDPEGLMISSYINSANRQLVTVVINYQENPVDIKLNVKGADKIKQYIPYVTSDKKEENLSPGKPVSVHNNIRIAGMSIVTLVSR